MDASIQVRKLVEIQIPAASDDQFEVMRQTTEFQKFVNDLQTMTLFISFESEVRQFKADKRPESLM